MAAAKSRTAAPKVTPPERPCLPASELLNLCQSLEEIEQAANGYAELKEAVLVTDLDGVQVTATYRDRNWSIQIG